MALFAVSIGIFVNSIELIGRVTGGELIERPGLIEKEYIKKVQSDEDRRNSHLHLTEKGRQINAMHAYAHERFSELIEETLTSDEMEKLVQILGKLVSKI